MLPLTRPLVALDIESTGTNPDADRIVELGLVRLDPDGTRSTWRWLLHPGRPIPPETTAIHGFTDEAVADQPGFVDEAGAIAAALTGVDLCGFGLRGMDLPMLRAEFARAEVPWPCEGARVVDAYEIFRDREPRSLGKAVRFYCERELVGAHGAVADAAASLDVLLAQVEHYPDLPRDLAGLDVASGGRRPDWATELGHLRWHEDGHLTVGFGKHKGRRLYDLDDGFLRWVLRNDFPADVRALCEDVLRGAQPMAPGFLPPPPPPPPPPADFGAPAADDDIPF